MQGAKAQSEEARLKQNIRLSPEAQQIASVMELCIGQVRIAAALPAVLQLDTASSVVHKELTGLLKKHQELVEALETLEGPKHETQKEKEEEAAEAKRSLTARLHKDIRNSVRDVLRHLRTHPDTAFVLEAELNVGIGESEEILITSLKMFQSHMLLKLQASLDEEPQLPTLSPLNNDLKQTLVQEEKHYPATAPSEQGNDAQGVASPVTDTQEQSQPQPRTHSTRQSGMQQEIDQLKAQLYNLIVENSQKEAVLQEKNEQVELEIKYLLKNFDNEMEETQNKLESMEQIYEKEQEEVRRLDKLCAALEPQYNQIQEKRRLAEEKRREETKDLELKTKAAIYAQAWWRGHSTRMALKNKVKSKKAKKGKKTKGTK